MLRVFFLHHRKLLGGLCRAGWEVVRELMAAALGAPSFRPGMVAVVQTHGDRLDWHPHVHAIATRGGWDAEGGFVPMPSVSTTAAERLFRHKVITLLRDEDLLTEEREASEFLARLLQHVPEPRLHQVPYYGFYSNVARARRAEGEGGREVIPGPEATEPGAPERRRLRRSWAQMIRRVYEVDPLTCAECGSEMRILAFLLVPAVVRRILDHLDKRPDRTRAPPAPAGVATAALP